MNLRWFQRLAAAFTLAVAYGAAAAQAPAQPVTAPAVTESQVELYRIAPGMQEEFLKFVALCDAANKEAGMAPRQLYVHQDGADWDFLLIQPLHTTDAQDKAWSAAATRLGIPHGGNFFLAIRKYIAVHTDTATTGPTTAADWLAKLHK
jgi:hypothetical protein